MSSIFQILHQATSPCLVKLKGPKRNHRGKWTSLRKAALSVQNQVSLNKDLKATENYRKTFLSQAPDVVLYFSYNKKYTHTK